MSLTAWFKAFLNLSPPFLFISTKRWGEIPWIVSFPITMESPVFACESLLPFVAQAQARKHLTSSHAAADIDINHTNQTQSREHPEQISMANNPSTKRVRDSDDAVEEDQRPAKRIG